MSCDHRQRLYEVALHPSQAASCFLYLLVQYSYASLPGAMPRPLEFDRQRALTEAMKVFWSQGYEATSLNALLDAMNIARSSFYSSFSSKKALFIECLELFGQRTLALAEDASGAHPPDLRIIRHYFEASVLRPPQSRLQRGCLLVNSILELADTHPELSAMAAQQLECIQQRFEQVLHQAELKRHWHSPLSAEMAASYLMIINQGVRVQARKRVDRAQLWASVENALSLIGLDSSPIA